MTTMYNLPSEESTRINNVTKIHVPSSFSGARTSKAILEGAGVEGVNGKFSRVSEKTLNDAPYYRNAAGFEISLQKGGQHWAIRGPNNGIFYWAQNSQTEVPPTMWHPHTLGKGQPILRMEVEREAGDVKGLTPRSEANKENYPETPLDREGTPVMKMSFMQTPHKLATTPSRTPSDQTREGSETHESRRTSCYEDNDVESGQNAASPPVNQVVDSPQPPQTIPVTQPHQPSMMPQWSQPLTTFGVPLAPAGQVYIPQMQIQVSPMVMAQPAYGLPVTGLQLSAPNTMTLNAGAQQAIANSPGLQQLQNQIFSGSLGLMVPQQQQPQVYYKDGIWPTDPASGQFVHLPTPEKEEQTEKHTLRPRSGSHPPGLGFTPRPEEEETTPAQTATTMAPIGSVAELGGERLTIERPRTSSAGAIAPPSSSEEPAAKPRFYRVVVEQGITYRMTNEMSDLFNGQVAHYNEVVEVEEHDGSFVRCKFPPLWLPCHYGDKTLMEPCDNDVATYKVLLKPGISYRKTMDMDDKSKRAFAAYGTEVTVYKVEGNWALIPGGHFLPLTVGSSGHIYPALELVQPCAKKQLLTSNQDTISSGSDSMNGSIEILWSKTDPASMPQATGRTSPRTRQDQSPRALWM